MPAEYKAPSFLWQLNSMPLNTAMEYELMDSMHALPALPLAHVFIDFDGRTTASDVFDELFRSHAADRSWEDVERLTDVQQFMAASWRRRPESPNRPAREAI
jgi:hypothetical protein